MYITDIDLGDHGECVECNIGTYRFEKPSKNQLKFMKIITIGIPIQMDILMLPLPKKTFAWCSLDEHNSEFTFSFLIILGALKTR